MNDERREVSAGVRLSQMFYTFMLMVLTVVSMFGIVTAIGDGDPGFAAAFAGLAAVSATASWFGLRWLSRTKNA